MRGVFITFEGGDGAGKTTQLQLLAAALSKRGYTVVQTREPGGTMLGTQIRELLLHGGAVSPRAEALLYAADRAQHVASVIRPGLEAGAVVLSDRYIDSSLAYQGGARELGAGIRAMSEWATEELWPDLTVLLDIPENEGLTRADDGQYDRIEAEGRVISYSADTEWTDALIPAARDADLFIAEAYTYDRMVKNHLSLKTLEAHLPAINARRVVLTHMSDDMLGRVGDLPYTVASDGMVVVF